ncbi:hypothetical protein GWI33_021247 [Rhynchophorus ferrugineus]|uniref:Uncharacterized protein n=1 Tax=Rhynchophorus ferrugineus TaxID=354439 RepID=A0A834HQB3_RHYFE|nr:hypothetical protein GWI33_021247 [Rhynchophorus ferrugineus]
MAISVREKNPLITPIINSIKVLNYLRRFVVSSSGSISLRSPIFFHHNVPFRVLPPEFFIPQNRIDNHQQRPPFNSKSKATSDSRTKVIVVDVVVSSSVSTGRAPTAATYASDVSDTIFSFLPF